MRKLFLATAALLSVMGAGTANAALIVTFAQNGANVDASGVGSLNFLGLTFDSFFFGNEFVKANSADLLLGPVPSSATDFYRGTISGPSSFGSGGVFNATSGGTNSPFGNGAGIDGSLGIFVPGGYNAGDPIAVNATWANTTLSGLGLTSGTYTWTWGTPGVNADSFEVIIPGTSTAVPEPLTLSLFGAGLAGAFVMRRKKAA